MTTPAFDNHLQTIDNHALASATGGKSFLHRIGGDIKHGAGKVAGAAHSIVDDASAGTTIGGGLGAFAGPEGIPVGAIAGLGFGTGFGIGEALAK